MDCYDIIVNYLKENGYDGIFNNDGECACDVEDFQPCEMSCLECIPGYKGKPPKGFEDSPFWLYKKKPKEKKFKNET